MSKKTLLEQVQAATPEDKKLIESLLAASSNVKLSLLNALSEITNPTIRSKFLQYVVEVAIAVSQETKITASDRNLGFEEMVAAFTRPEALKILAPTRSFSCGSFQGSASQTAVVVWR